MRRIIQGRLTRVSLAVSFSALFFAIVWIAGRATPLAQFLAGASIIIVFAHASAALGWSEALSFLTICLAVTFTVENFGVLTGFPFGHYTFLVEPNIPHIGVIPPIVGLLYFGMGYPSWVIANLLLGQSVQRPSTRLQLFAVPTISAFVMVQWDVVKDPSGSTLARAWVWYGGGGYFGVPLSNFLGWFLVTYLYYQAFSLFLYARDEAALSLPPACLVGTANIALPRRRSLPRPAALRSGHPPRRRRRPGMVGGGPARDRRNRHALHHAADLHSGALSARSPWRHSSAAMIGV
jgi:uncharacterized membrane protein